MKLGAVVYCYISLLFVIGVYCICLLFLEKGDARSRQLGGALKGFAAPQELQRLLKRPAEKALLLGRRRRLGRAAWLRLERIWGLSWPSGDGQGAGAPAHSKLLLRFLSGAGLSVRIESFCFAFSRQAHPSPV